MKLKRGKGITLLAQTALHVWVILFLANVGVASWLTWRSEAQGCMSLTQVAGDSRCLYVYGQQVYQLGTRESPQWGYECGLDLNDALPQDVATQKAVVSMMRPVATTCPGEGSAANEAVMMAPLTTSEGSPGQGASGRVETFWMRALGWLGLLSLGAAFMLGVYRSVIVRKWGQEQAQWLKGLSLQLAGVSVLGHIMLVEIGQSGVGESLWGADVVEGLTNWSSSGDYGWWAVGLGILLWLSKWFLAPVRKMLGFRGGQLGEMGLLGVLFLGGLHTWERGEVWSQPLVLVGVVTMVVLVLWRLNLAVWQVFNLPRPKRAEKVETKKETKVMKQQVVTQTVVAGKKAGGAEVVKTYYVVSQEPVAESGGRGWWLMLSDGISRIYGYFVGEGVPRREWLKVKARQMYDEHQVPYLAISQLMPV